MIKRLSPSGFSFELGPIPSKKNRWKRGSTNVFLPAALKATLDALTFDLISQRNGHNKRIGNASRMPLQAPCIVTALFSIVNDREDLDNMYTTLLDLLEDSGIILNDKLVVEGHQYKHINPGKAFTQITVSYA